MDIIEELKRDWFDAEFNELSEKAIDEILRLRTFEEDARRYAFLRENAKETYLHPNRVNSEICPDIRTKWEIPTLICSGPIGGFIEFDDAVDILIGR